MLGLTPQWCRYGAALILVSTALIVGRWLELPNSYRGFLLHLGILTFAVIAQAQIWAWLPITSIWAKRARIALAGCFLFAMVALQVTNFVSFEFLHTGPSIGLVPAYISHLHHVAAAVGVSLVAIGTGVALTLCLCIAVVWFIFRDEKDYSRKSPLALAMLVLALGAHSLTPDYFKKHEFLHKIAYGFPTELAPRSLMDLTQPRLEPRYASPPSQVDARPLVLITVDALRADATHVYGNATRNTPFLSELAEANKLRRFDQTYSICSVSYCGLLGIIASRSWDGMTRTPDNIADALADHGYRNHFFLSGAHESYFGLKGQYGENIATYREGADAAGQYPNDDRLLLRWIENFPIQRGESNFYWFHLMDVHNLGLRRSEVTVEIQDAQLQERIERGGSSLATYAQRYHDGILSADRTIAEIFGWLDRTEQLEDALVVITSDHGEYLGEGNRTAHGGMPWEPTINVPLLVYGNEVASWPTRNISSTVDVAPTILEAIGARIPLGYEGIPLQRPTTRCAVRAASRATRVLIGEGSSPRLWSDEEGDEFLEPASSNGPLTNRVDTSSEREQANNLKACASRR